MPHRIEHLPNVEAGDRVCITTGPVAGMEVSSIVIKNELRVVLRLEMIGCSVAVEVGAAEISYVEASEARGPILSWYESAEPIYREHAAGPA